MKLFKESDFIVKYSDGFDYNKNESVEYIYSMSYKILNDIAYCSIFMTSNIRDGYSYIFLYEDQYKLELGKYSNPPSSIELINNLNNLIDTHDFICAIFSNTK